MTPLIGVAGAWDLVLAVARNAAREGIAALPMTTEVAGGTITVRAGGLWTADVDVAVDAAALLDLYLPLATRADLVIGQVGQSLDGRVATESGHSHYVTGEEDIVRLHRVRALVDAVLIGAGTAVADDPRLTVRHVEGAHPARVILDPNGRVDPVGALFTDDVAPTLWIRRGPAPTKLAAHVEAIEPPEASADGTIAPAALIGLMRTRGWRRILVEGGGVTVSTFLQAGVLDRLHVTVAPLLIGAGRHGITLPPVLSLDQALRPRCRHFALGADVLFDLELGPDPVAPDRA
jgi:diaminohydroxyphosphoribosylaminopyrimidine deaminase / 5-amino-6-(5-phosphoribosylamino)uracil reductase